MEVAQASALVADCVAVKGTLQEECRLQAAAVALCIVVTTVPTHTFTDDDHRRIPGTSGPWRSWRCDKTSMN